MNNSEINTLEGTSKVDNASIAIVASRYNSIIVDRLMRGCVEGLNDGGIDDKYITVGRVPGAFEIPLAVKKMADTKQYDAIITLGAVIRGETPHFDFIATECSRGISTIALQTDIPIIFGVLTVDTSQQAMDRSGDEESNKGNEAARTALEMINLLRKIT